MPGSTHHPASSGPQPVPLTGAKLLLAVLAIGLGNFLVVLDTTIANVSVPTFAGALGALVGGRVLLGLVGGPIMPLSQMLLLRVLPPEKATMGTVLWAMTTLVAPVAGPILGGIICDSIGWEWIFFIKVPVALAGGLTVLYLLRGRTDKTDKVAIDKVGLALLVLWVGALQIMLDEGRNLDWFSSSQVRLLAAVAAVGFAAFVIWEMTARNPIVDLRIFRHRGFVAASVTYAVAFGAFLASVVILPLWLQQNMGYTATWAGYATGIIGALAIVSAPAVGKTVEKYDPRVIVSIGILGLGAMTAWRLSFNPGTTFAQMAVPTLLSGPFMVMFFVPVTGLAMASVPAEEQANAAGISNFLRTLGGAFATAIIQTGWANAARHNQTELAGAMTNGQAALDGMVAGGVPRESATAILSWIVEGQSVMLATLNMFAAITVCFAFAATLIWLAPRPKGPIDTSGGH